MSDSQLETFVSTVDKWLTAEDIVINVDLCTGCNNCGQACAWYLETDDPRLHPRYRADVVRNVYKRYIAPSGKILGALGLIPTPTLDDLKADMDTFWKCTACGRCTLACPMGISTRRLIRIGRAAYTESGLSETNATLKAVINNTKEKKHSFGLTLDQVFGRSNLFLRFLDTDIPINVKGAKYLFVCPAAGNARIPDLGVFLMQVLNASGLSYTVTPDVIDTGTEIDHISVHHQLSKQMLEEWEDAAERLQTEAIVIAECGCDVRTVYHEATETLGRPFKFPIVSIDTLLEQAIDDGALPVEPIDSSVTFHDPCYLTRLSGQGERYRRLLPKLVKDFREMTPNREYNYCCNGGSGGLKMVENTELRRKVSQPKINQIKATGADLVTTPCAVCYLTLKDITESYGLATPDNRKTRMFFEIVHAAMMKALTARNETGRVKRPSVFQGKDEAWVKQHSGVHMLEERLQNPAFRATMDWLKADAIVQAFGKRNAGFTDMVAKLEAGIPSAAKEVAP